MLENGRDYEVVVEAIEFDDEDDSEVIAALEAKIADYEQKFKVAYDEFEAAQQMLEQARAQGARVEAALNKHRNLLAVHTGQTAKTTNVFGQSQASPPAAAQQSANRPASAAPATKKDPAEEIRAASNVIRRMPGGLEAASASPRQSAFVPADQGEDDGIVGARRGKVGQFEEGMRALIPVLMKAHHDKHGKAGRAMHRGGIIGALNNALVQRTGDPKAKVNDYTATAALRALLDRHILCRVVVGSEHVYALPELAEKYNMTIVESAQGVDDDAIVVTEVEQYGTVSDDVVLKLDDSNYTYSVVPVSLKLNESTSITPTEVDVEQGKAYNVRMTINEDGVERTVNVSLKSGQIAPYGGTARKEIVALARKVVA